MRSKLEWGYLPQARSLTSKIFVVLIATGVGASAGGLVALSFVERFVDKKGQEKGLAPASRSFTVSISRLNVPITVL